MSTDSAHRKNIDDTLEELNSKIASKLGRLKGATGSKAYVKLREIATVISEILKPIDETYPGYAKLRTLQETANTYERANVGDEEALFYNQRKKCDSSGAMSILLWLLLPQNVAARATYMFQDSAEAQGE